MISTTVRLVTPVKTAAIGLVLIMAMAGHIVCTLFPAVAFAQLITMARPTVILYVA